MLALLPHPAVVLKYDSSTDHLVINIIVVIVRDGIHGRLNLSLLLLLQDVVLLDDMVNLGFVHYSNN